VPVTGIHSKKARQLALPKANSAVAPRATAAAVAAIVAPASVERQYDGKQEAGLRHV
jgi:hypothetical protein